MNPEQYKPGYSGPSFDCTAARRTLDRLVCIDAGLSKADSALGAAYSGAKRLLSPESFASVSAAQKAWLAWLATVCGASGALPESGGDRNNAVDCLNDEYVHQTALLSGLEPARSGNLVIEPHVRFRARRSPASEESDAWPVMSGGAQAAPFNAFVGGTLHTDRWRMDDKTLFPGDSGDNASLRASRDYSVVRFDRRIASFQISTDDYSGGNRDAYAQQSLTWDIAKARLVTLDDVFAAGSKWKAVVMAACRRGLKKQLEERGGELDDSDIAAAVSSASNWLWKRDKATIVFWVDTISGAPGGEFDVDIPFKTLAPFLRADAPVR